MRTSKKNDSVCFKRWSRKGYAIFASLHKVVKIAVITCSCSLVLMSHQGVKAQSIVSDSTQRVDLDEIEISAEQPIPWSAASGLSQILDRSQLSGIPGQQIESALRSMPGVDVRQRGMDGMQTDISLRGGSFDQTVILLNGIAFTDPQTGHYNLDLPVQLQQLQRIEILQGSAARLLAPAAFSGAINLVTTNDSDPDGLKAYAELGLGSFQRWMQATHWSYKQDKIQFSGQLNHQKSDGYRHNTDYDRIDGLMHVRLETTAQQAWSAQIGVQTKEFGANGFYSLAYPNQFDATRTYLGSIQWNLHRSRSDHQIQGFFRRHHDRFELFRAGIGAADWYTGPNQHRSDVGGFQLKNKHIFNHTRLQWGAELRNEHIYSTVLGEPIDHHAKYSHAKNRLNARWFVDPTWYVNRWSLGLGASANWNNDFGFYWTGGSRIQYQMGQQSQLALNWQHAVRLPSFTDLYYKSATQIGNASLDPEQSDSWELSASGTKGKIDLAGNLWYRNGRQLIDWIRFPDETVWRSQNLTRVNAMGTEMLLRWTKPIKGIRHMTTGYSWMQMDKEAQGYDSKYALDYLQHKWNGSVQSSDLTAFRWLRIAAVLDASYSTRVGTFTDPNDNLLKKYQPEWLLNTGIQWDCGMHWQWKASVQNLLNADRYDFGGLPLPGASYQISLRYQIQ